MTTNRLLNYLIFIHFSFAALSLTACGIDRKHAERIAEAEKTSEALRNMPYEAPIHPPSLFDPASPSELETAVDCGTLVGNGKVVVMTDNGPQLIVVVCPYRPKTTT